MQENNIFSLGIAIYEQISIIAIDSDQHNAVAVIARGVSI